MMASRLSLSMSWLCLSLTDFIPGVNSLPHGLGVAIPHLPPTKLQPQREAADFPAALQTSPRGVVGVA